MDPEEKYVCHDYCDHAGIVEEGDTIVLAVDIERTGGFPHTPTIGIGASVVNQHFDELACFFEPGYFNPDVTPFEPRCWDEFWSQNEDKLSVLQYNGSLKHDQRQKEMIQNFQDFRARWEKKCKDNKANLVLVTDNNVFDGGFINQMIFTHLPETMPIPYEASKPQKYERFVDVTSMQLGLLATSPPMPKWGLDKRINELYDVASVFQPIKSHDHHPANDAYTIACDYHIVVKCGSGEIPKK